MPDHPVVPAEKRAGRRRWAAGAILGCAVLLLLLGGLAAWRPAPLLRLALSLSGHDAVTFEQLRVGLHGLELTGVAIGSDQRPSDPLLARLRLDYRPGGLLRGRIEEVSVEGLRLRGSLDEHGLRLAGLDGAAAGGDEGAGLPVIPLPERVSIRDARLELTTPVGVLAVPFEARVRPERERAVFTLDAGHAELAAPAGRLRADLHVQGEMPLDAQALAREATASGWAELRADALTVPGIAVGVDGTGKLLFAWGRGQLDASLSNARAQLAALAPEWDALAALLPAPWRVEFARPAHISASLVGDGVRLEGSGEIALVTAGPQVQAALGATLGLDADRRIRELMVSDGKVDVRDLHLADLHLERGSAQLEGAGSLDAWRGSLALDLAGAGAPLPGLMLDGATAQADLDVRLADGRLSGSLRKPAALQTAALRWADAVRVSRLEARLQPGSGPLLSAQLADGAVAWRQRMTARLSEFEVATTGRAPIRLRAAADALEVELAGDRQGLETGRVVLRGGAVRVPAQAIHASGIALEVGLSADGLAPGAPIPVSIASIVHEGTPPWFAPLRVAGSVQPSGDQLAFDLELARIAGDLRMRVRGRHDLASARGSAELSLPAVAFAPGGLQPAALAPALVDVIGDVSGQLALDGTLAWGAGGDVRADLELLVEDLAFSSGPARFERVNGVIAFDRLAPLSTPPGQQLAVGLVDIGLPLTNGLLTFDLEPGELIVEQLRWQFAEGRIRAAPFTIGSGEIRFSTTLTAERLQLDEIFALAQLEGLTGQGTMHGTLPITVAGAEAVIAKGELVSDRPGWVRYRPDQAPPALQAGGENVNLLLQALENFRYQELRLTIDGRTDGEMDVRLHIKGANPDLYDGYPIEFNLNLEGALADVLRAGLAGYQIPERIRERMLGFGR